MKWRRKSPKKDVLEQATCPECWQTVRVHNNRTYAAHDKLNGQDSKQCSRSGRLIQPLFALGEVVATPGALEALTQANLTPEALIRRHHHGDWGQLPPEDVQANIDGVQQGMRLLSSYPLPSRATIWIITEWDRSVTTLLLPDE